MTTFHIETVGCTHNFADSEQMAGLLKKAQFTPVENIEEADIIIFNTCTVKSPTANAFFKRLEEVRAEHRYKIIIIAGCIAQTEPKRVKKYPLIGTRQIHNVVEIVEEALNDNIIHNLEMGEMPPLDVPRIKKSPIIEIIPIARGCLNACSFCKTKHARGKLQSYPTEDIAKRVVQAVKEGSIEIWFTSQDNMCYGFDLGTNLARLLHEIVSINGKFKVRIGMGNPEHLMKFKDELAPLLNHEKIFKFIHLPIQSGSNKVLENMKRGSSKEEYIALVKELRERVPNITIATDIIVGFPTETEEDFWETLNLVRAITPDIVNISKFWARPDTPAAKMKQLPGELVKRRSKVLTDIFQNISKLQNERWKGWEGYIIIDENGKGNENENENNQWIGRNGFYKQVVVEGNFKLGDILPVKIVRTGIFDLKGEVTE